MIVNRLQHQGGYGWKLQKLHELIHILYQMTMFGSLANWDAGPGKSALKTWAKNLPKHHKREEWPFLMIKFQNVCMRVLACFLKAK